jgi:hypothetical protein
MWRVLVESGDELIRHFELDTYGLDTIINEHAKDPLRVERDDIALLAMSGLREQYLVMRLQDSHDAPSDDVGRACSLRAYLYDKYVYRHDEPKQGDGRNGEVRNGDAKQVSEPENRVSPERPAA